MITKLESLALEKVEREKLLEAEREKRALREKMKQNDNTPIHIDQRWRANKAEFESLKPYIRTLRKKKTWNEMHKDVPV
ncbi:hypothetical protein AU074_13795 [Pseudomonas sp. ATCC PTA-122608]|uniref:hypothetical protein n=1 Tax=Pseudomonas sp. ATCC PTA-122608 TaxID=1771311 RepID=UPI00096BC493|nr:hypothetical protein [Pseudomonas sp. ATCC PTA-122608]OLY72243.1 hypothetical protein AU074_13795 [Pseudomonas sp. ATCC PTA-122608]